VEPTGVILAAGFGSRITAAGYETIKPLLPVGSVPVLLRALRQLELAGCRRIVVVVGHRRDEIEAALVAWRASLRARIETVMNPEYRLKNGVSLLAARELLPGRYILAMADHVVGGEIMLLAGGHEPPKHGATLLVDRRVKEVFDLDDATKVRTEGDRLLAIGKALHDFDAIDIGVFVGTDGLLEALAQVYAESGDASLSEGVERLAQAGRMSVLDVGDGFWQDVDDGAMLAHAERELARRGE
jgi:choline kinase